MGAWGSGPFDNDAALDWIDQLDRETALEQLKVALRAATTDGSISPDAAAIGVAAAAVVASRRTTEFMDRVGDLASADADLPRLALAALNRISTDSELAMLWEERGAGEWHRRIDQLSTALLQAEQGQPAAAQPSATPYTCGRRGHTKRLLTQTGAGLAVAAWHAETAAQGDRTRLVGVRAEVLDVMEHHADPTCPIRAGASTVLPEVEACIQDPARAIDAIAAAISSLQDRVAL